MNHLKPTLLYCFALILMSSFALILHFLFSGTDWASFFDAASIFLPVLTWSTLGLFIFILAVYVFRKAYNFGKKKEHVRFL